LLGNLVRPAYTLESIMYQEFRFQEQRAGQPWRTPRPGATDRVRTP
jgi:hypothetical protein